MTTPCVVCGTPVPVGTGGRCALHKAPHRRYRSTRAHRNAACAVTASVERCPRCGGPGPFEAAHPAPLADGAAMSSAGLVPLCVRCHDADTAAEAEARKLRGRM